MSDTNGKWLVSDQTVYQLDDYGLNRWSARVQADYKKVTPMECTLIARIMASAPDMYEALEYEKLANDELIEHGDNPVYKTLRLAYISRRDKALAKAKGLVPTKP